ncbi:sulfatase family protein [Phytoactinopolyspora halotolerans]|uniref:Sulfatase-like hydrolase/transferase n=1 Tax=Phytoactinopolyspora halotolerans TaxID=1981512 RepID=A0A6L9SCD8_9ACTN|nr:sulfatase-like hydrolase/transferase [Phytoactinopolyspora halotolerans]NEE02228.1 sulfatase-like hydrolase/transferase [Phytoactinopolyspora halotolerans]
MGPSRYESAEVRIVKTGGRLNVLLIMADQMSADAMSCAGNPDVHTPAIDSLAAAGVRFDNAYCTSPLCAPSRASMMTGLMPSELGIDDNVQVPDRPFPERSLGRVFADAGYDCAYGGKWHVPGAAHEASAVSGWAGAPEGSVASGFTEIYGGSHEGLAAACAEYLAAPDRRDAPFLLVASFNEPHGICEWARGQAPPSGEVPDVDWRELPVLPPNFAPGSEEPEALRLVQRYAWTVHPTQGWDEERWRRYRYAYFRLCERVDAEIGSLLAALDSSGLREETVVVFTSDHGDMQGAHQWNQKKNLYEESAGVPFIVVPPGDAPNGAANRDGRVRGAADRDEGVVDARVREELVSVGLDLLPTLCDYAGIAPDPTWAGTSVRPLVGSASHVHPSWRDQVIVETQWRFPGLMPPPVMSGLIARMLRTSRYAYMCHSWGLHREQLFDLRRDPGEMTNLATDGAHQGILAEHRRRLAEHCEARGDGFARYVPGPDAAPR